MRKMYFLLLSVGLCSFHQFCVIIIILDDPVMFMLKRKRGFDEQSKFELFKK